MTTAFVTGATGFLGAHLTCILLQQGYRVKAGKRLSSSLTLFENVIRYYGLGQNYGPEWVEAELDDAEALLNNFKDCDVVFHCAAKVSFWKKDNAALYETNVIGTRSIVDACLRAKVPALIHVSSVAALSRKPGEDFITESTIWRESPLNSEYAKSKYLSELEVLRGSEEGLNVSIINPGVILGPGDGIAGSNQIYRMVKNGLRYLPEGTNGFVGVTDVARMMVLQYEKKVFGKRILSVAENMPFKDLLTDVATLLKKSVPNRRLTPAIVNIAYAVTRVLEFLHIPSPAPSQALLSTTAHSHYQSENLHLLGDFTFTPISKVNALALAFLYP